ncbi:hypothetical protein [Bradyrhizobium sp. SZCCHNR3003]|uniref:hypothetical protein n=1 Tax=Bradyrhizobium sp. SZCCHNR3003 TaxID=3057387 RepID=UPI002915EFD0|nr:hypothetical protein [Bradyrhizobium sp. SZCCHNR3003]
MTSCKNCFRVFREDEDDDECGTWLCCECFETALDDYEERRRRLIAERNEY